MHLIFIRHGDPDYKNNTVTAKGAREASYLAERIAGWNVTDFYCSPYGRAQDTLKPAMKLTGRIYEVKDWLKEFDHKVKDPVAKEEKGGWDFMPDYYFAEKKFFDKDRWWKARIYKDSSFKKFYDEVTSGLDEVLLSHGYRRVSKDKPVYRCTPHIEGPYTHEEHLKPHQDVLDETNLVFTCHLGIMFVLISYLTGLSPCQMWQGFFVAPTSVTVLGAEERKPGEVFFRLQMLGDVSHLTSHNEEASASGYFGNFTNF